MNYCGSYRKLLENAKAAMVAAIEVYNKPSFSYREECVVILLVNAWELLLKSVLLKRKEKIYYDKERNQPRRSLSLTDALHRARNVLGRKFPPAWEENLRIVQQFRDDATHFYNNSDMPGTLYMLFQANIKNFRDMMSFVFSENLENSINWRVMPLGISPPIDAVSYLTDKYQTGNEIAGEITKALHALKSDNKDTEGLISVFKIQLVSCKSGDADVRVAVDSDNPQAFIALHKQDPNVSHPFRQTEVLKHIGEKLCGRNFTSFVFQAIVARYKIKDNDKYCWRDKRGSLTTYSSETLKLIKNLSVADVDESVLHYKKHLRCRAKQKNK